MERRSRSMSQWVRGGLTGLASVPSPSTSLPTWPFLHSHSPGISASSAKGTSKMPSSVW